MSPHHPERIQREYHPRGSASRNVVFRLAFISDKGFGQLKLNQQPLTEVVLPKSGKTPGLLALKTAGRW